MRGEHFVVERRAHVVAGIIPACAGSTGEKPHDWDCIGDHPRMRGEHQLFEGDPDYTPGSSPHARGARFDEALDVCRRGIIPACAGSTRARTSTTCTTWDHPRMRGEHLNGWFMYVYLAGSSPHARGALDILSRLQAVEGIIPTCAGSTVEAASPTSSGRDHPRMRGEHHVPLWVASCFLGSSPHARGALTPSFQAFAQVGIIPACAGSTQNALNYRADSRDHPRMRGEHNGAGIGGTDGLGSSPHARGALFLLGAGRPKRGIIPACAGSTRRSERVKTRSRDHPRMRGEHRRNRVTLRPTLGSSPHARGAHFATSASGQHSRLIHSLFASSGHPSGLSSDYIFARRDTCWHCSNPWRAHRQVSRHQCHSVGG